MKIVIIGSGGRLGAALTRAYRDKFDVVGFNHAQLDLTNFEQVREKITALDFDVLINCAAFTNVDLCETEREQAFQINAEAPRVLAEICREKKAKLIHFSTDYVFDGEKREPYTEDDAAKPISFYGESKREGEKLVLQTQDRHLVVRVSWVFGPDRPSFVDGMIKRAREYEHVDAIADKFSTPTYTSDIAEMLLKVVAAVADRGSGGAGRGSSAAGVNDPGYSGILHFANAGECSWQEYAQFSLDCCRSLGIPLKAKTVGALKLSEMKNWIARRPVYSVLSTTKYIAITGSTPRGWRDAVGDYVREFVPR
ncbi:MAG: dTDP-4-dehydrorhamnose reductase [Chthoniobacterales bacterium]